MSQRHARFLQRVGREFFVSAAALEFVVARWDDALMLELRVPNQVTRADAGRALLQIRSTFTIRLFAEFEAMLRDYLIQVLPETAMPQDVTSSFLIDQTYRLYRGTISSALYQSVHELRDLRNRLAHRREVTGREIPFADVLSILSRFVDKLPES